MKTRIVVLTIALLIAWGLKRHYADAAVEDLRWILSPTVRLVSITTGTTFTLQAGEGYFSREHLFLIEKSCAGVNFMIAAFGMVVVALFQRIESATTAARVLGVSLLASYASAVLVNVVRIAIAMWLADYEVAVSGLTAADVHRLEGIIVYFGGLLLLYELVTWFDRRNVVTAFSRTVVLLGAYYGITLVVPFANGVAWNAAFAKHALVVLVVPPMLVLLACAGRALVRCSVRPLLHGLICVARALSTSLTKYAKKRAMRSRPGVEIAASVSPVV